jgi:hypothetical protein
MLTRGLITNFGEKMFCGIFSWTFYATAICDAVAYSDSPVCVCVCVCVCYIDYIVNLKNLLVKNY